VVAVVVVVMKGGVEGRGVEGVEGGEAVNIKHFIFRFPSE